MLCCYVVLAYDYGDAYLWTSGRLVNAATMTWMWPSSGIKSVIDTSRFAPNQPSNGMYDTIHEIIQLVITNKLVMVCMTSFSQLKECSCSFSNLSSRSISM